MKKKLNTLIGAVALLLIINACSAPAPETAHADTTEAVTTAADASTADTAAPDTTATDTTPADTADAAATPAAPAVTADVAFETTDLDGNTVNSADLFAASKLTMINIWGTFCGPCISEMP